MTRVSKDNIPVVLAQSDREGVFVEPSRWITVEKDETHVQNLERANRLRRELGLATSGRSLGLRFFAAVEELVDTLLDYSEESYLYLATDGSSKNAWCHGFCFPAAMKISNPTLAAIHPPCLRYGGTSKVKISMSTPETPLPGAYVWTAQFRDNGLRTCGLGLEVLSFRLWIHRIEYACMIGLGFLTRCVSGILGFPKNRN